MYALLRVKLNVLFISFMTVFFLGVFEIAGWIFFLWKHHNLHFFFWFAQALWWAHCHIFHNTQLHYQCLEKSCKWSKGMFVPRFSDLLKQPFPSQFFHTRNQWFYHLNVPRKFNFFWQSYDFCWLSNTHVHDVLLYSHIFLIYVACIVWNFIYH